MVESALLIAVRDRVATLTLNRPERLNAVNADMYRPVLAALDTFERATDATDSVRAIVVTGAGRAFCAGADLVAHGTGEATSEQRREYIALGQTVARRLQQSPLPVVAAVNGHAIGAGLEMALAADLIVVASEAKLRFPEIALGTFVGGGVVHTLPRRVGAARARELLLLGDFFRGDEAAAMGLANRVVAATEVLPQAMAWAQQLASRAPISMRLAKQVLDQAPSLPTAQAMDLEAAALLECMGTDDWKEGIRAFHDKRQPQFRGR